VNSGPNFPPIGSRVSIRYQDSAGEQTDIIGVLTARPPHVEIRATGGAVMIAVDDVIAVRELSFAPVRNSEIRTLEYAAALGWPGMEQHWHQGWLLRAGDGTTSRGNSAVPLDFSSSLAAVPAIADWYVQRDLVPWLAVPDRLLAVRAASVKRTRVMVRDLVDADAGRAGPSALLSETPDDAWLACYRRAVPVAELTAVVDGKVVFARIDGIAVGRGALTTAPDGTRWLGISAVTVSEAHRRRGHGRSIWAALTSWGVSRGAQRSYVQVLTDNEAAITLYASLGYGLHHHAGYLDARRVLGVSLGE
jgi:ribosomal protein S18 acetylase RimI-like enzyme